MTFADRLLDFLPAFPAPPALPPGVTAVSPYAADAPRELLTRFARRFYADNCPRVAVLGINPGRFGGGTTGIAFTDPVALADACQLANPLPRRRELSSEFVYQVIEAMGGPTTFYAHFYLGSVYPLVLLKDGLNHNYYDSPALLRTLRPSLLAALRQQMALGFRPEVVVSLGRRNAQVLRQLNQGAGLFADVIALDHPRYIMQYRRRQLPAYVAEYVAVLGGLLP